MGMKPRKKPEVLMNDVLMDEEDEGTRCAVKLKRSDGYVSNTKGLSYLAGLAVSVVANRASFGESVEIRWDEGHETRVLRVPGEEDT